jgi:hypothetical protein
MNTTTTHRDEYGMPMTDPQYYAVEAVRIAGMQAGENTHEGEDGHQYFATYTYEPVLGWVRVRTGNGRFVINVNREGRAFASQFVPGRHA